MVIKGEELAANSTTEADIAIIGAGAAGITLTAELSSSNLKILLIESGDLSPQIASQKLAIGESSGDILPEGNHYLYASRLRYFGGSTNHWAGYTRPFDRIDFEERDWISHSGWPFSLDELKFGYQRANAHLGIHSFTYPKFLKRKFDSQNLFEHDKIENLKAKNRKSYIQNKDKRSKENEHLFTTRRFHIAKKRRLGKHYLQKFKTNKNVTLVLNSTVVELRLGQNTQQIVSARALTLGNHEFFFKARNFVLSAGGIENPRLLLLSNEVQKNGLGNQNDLVGRFFMEHPHLLAGRAFIYHRANRLKYLQKHYNSSLRHSISGTLCPTEKTMRKHQLLNLNIQLMSAFVCLKNGKLVNESKDLKKDAYPLLTTENQGGTYAYLKVRAEQSPNPRSRLTLSQKKDELGCQRARLNWVLNSEDFTSIKKNLTLLGRELGRCQLGRLQIDLHDQEDWPDLTYGGSHHMGTTRMHNSARGGVVDKQLKLHGYHNLFILGSSVFPTGGGVNPTLTIMALAVRLAERLKKTRI